MESTHRLADHDAAREAALRRPLLLTALVGALVIAGFVAAGSWVYDAVAEADGVAGLDRPVLNWAIAHRTPSTIGWLSAFTTWGSTVPMVVTGLVLTTAVYLRWRRRTVWVLMLLAAAGSVSFTLVGKAVFARSRPPLADAVPPYETSFSFPSGHTLNSCVVAGMLAYLVVWLARRWWTRLMAVCCAVAWTALMGFSRVFLGYHWLTDVIFAWFVGLAWLALLITAHQLLILRQAQADEPISLRPAD